MFKILSNFSRDTHFLSHRSGLKASIWPPPTPSLSYPEVKNLLISYNSEKFCKVYYSWEKRLQVMIYTWKYITLILTTHPYKNSKEIYFFSFRINLANLVIQKIILVHCTNDLLENKPHMAHLFCSHTAHLGHGQRLFQMQEYVRSCQFSVWQSLPEANHGNPLTTTLTGPLHLISMTYHTPSSFKKSTIGLSFTNACHWTTNFTIKLEML